MEGLYIVNIYFSPFSLMAYVSNNHNSSNNSNSKERYLPRPLGAMTALSPGAMAAYQGSRLVTGAVSWAASVRVDASRPSCLMSLNGPILLF